MTINQFINTSEKLAVHCSKKKQATVLLKAFQQSCLTWRSGEPYSANDFWDREKESTCYSNNGLYGSEQDCLEAGYKIIDFEEIEDLN